MSDATTGHAAAHLDERWHRALLDHLCRFPRETASEGEHAAARWLRDQLTAEGAQQVRIEDHHAHQTFWWPLGSSSVAGALAGWRAARGGRVGAALLGALAAWAAADELPPRRRRLRAVLPRRTATNVIASCGPATAERTVVVVAHHDSAHSGLVFSPAIPSTIQRVAPWFFDVSQTSPPLMWPAVIGPALSAAGALAGVRRLGWIGALISAAFAAAMVNIGASAVVPGANDNGTGVVAIIALARALARRPTESVRVLLVSTSEEGLCEGMRAFAARHFAELPPEHTFILVVDTVGSPHLLVLRGEGMLGVTEYPGRSLALVDGVAEELGIWLFPGLRLRNATDGVFALAAGYQCASLCSCTAIKQPANYHWPTDVPENVEFGTLGDAIRLIDGVVRRLDDSWLQESSSGPQASAGHR